MIRILATVLSALLTASLGCVEGPQRIECIDNDDCPTGRACVDLLCVEGAADSGTPCIGACPDAETTMPDAAVIAADAGETMADTGPVDSGRPAYFDRHNLVFVTSTAYRPGDIGGLEGADALCRSHAAQANLPRPDSYTAILSDAQTPARSRLAGSRGWVRMDGLPFADRLSDIESGVVWYPVAYTEFGLEPESPIVMTGATASLGQDPALFHCDSWTSTTARLGIAGDSREGTELWVDRRHAYLGNETPSCDAKYGLYCFGTGLTTPVEPPTVPEGGKLAFVTQGTIAPGNGIEAFDALCQTEADAAGLVGRRFVALATPGPEDIVLSRFDLTDGPWYRGDGVKVADSVIDISRDQLLAPVVVNANGVTYGIRVTWAGSFETEALPHLRACNGWQLADVGLLARGGKGGSTIRFFKGSIMNCSLTASLLCFEVDP